MAAVKVQNSPLPNPSTYIVQGMGDGADLYHLDKSQCKSCHLDGWELVSY